MTLPNAGKEGEKVDLSHTAGGNVKCTVTLKHSVAVSSKKKINKIHLPYNSAIALLGTYPRKTKIYVYTKTYAKLFTAALLVIAKTREQPKCPSKGQEWNWYIYTMECHSTTTTKRANDWYVQPPGWAWSVLWWLKASQSQKIAYCLSLFTEHSRNDKIIERRHRGEGSQECDSERVAWRRSFWWWSRLSLEGAALLIHPCEKMTHVVPTSHSWFWYCAIIM